MSDAGPDPDAAPLDLVNQLAMDATGRWPVSLRDVSLRPFPFPYAAGFALANENTFAEDDLFEDVHEFVCGDGATEFGDGLGLEIGDSAAIRDDGSIGLSVHPDSSKRDGRLLALIEAGWIDAAFCPDAAHAPPLVAALARIDCTTPPAVLLHAGDLASRSEFVAAGVRYFGDASLLESDKFGDHFEYKLIERFQLAAADYDWRQWAATWPLTSPPPSGDMLASRMNRTLQLADEDDRDDWTFKRYRGPWLPSMPTFSAQVNFSDLDRLTAHGGVAIVQQQLGLWSLIGASPEKSGERPNHAPALDRHAVAAWQDIAERRAAGRLWVAATSRLLDFLWRRQSLRFTVQKTSEKWVISLRGMQCPVFGGRPIERADLNGLSFTVGEGAPEVEVIVDGWRQPLDMRRETDPVHRLRHAVYLPWSALEWAPRPRPSPAA